MNTSGRDTFIATLHNPGSPDAAVHSPFEAAFRSDAKERALAAFSAKEVVKDGSILVLTNLSTGQATVHVAKAHVTIEFS